MTSEAKLIDRLIRLTGSAIGADFIEIAVGEDMVVYGASGDRPTPDSLIREEHQFWLPAPVPPTS